MALRFTLTMKLFLTGLLVLSPFLKIAGPTHAGTASNKSRLPPIYSNPIELIRAAQLAGHNWSDTNLPDWNFIGDFPKWGGNAFRIVLSPFADGQALLPGEALTLRLGESLKRYI